MEDFAITPYLLAKAKTVEAINYVGYNYVQHDNSLTKMATKTDEIKTRKNKLHQLKNVVKLAKKLINKTNPTFIIFAFSFPISKNIGSSMAVTKRVKHKNGIAKLAIT